jgi:hypothetical protein
VQAGLEGRLNVLGFGLAKVSGSLGVAVNLGVHLTDPNPADGKIYLTELMRLGKQNDLVQGFLSALGTDLTVDFQAHAKAKINLLIKEVTVWSHTWDLARLVDFHRPGPVAVPKKL